MECATLMMVRTVWLRLPAAQSSTPLSASSLAQVSSSILIESVLSHPPMPSSLAYCLRIPRAQLSSKLLAASMPNTTCHFRYRGWLEKWSTQHMRPIRTTNQLASPGCHLRPLSSQRTVFTCANGHCPFVTVLASWSVRTNSVFVTTRSIYKALTCQAGHMQTNFHMADWERL